VRLARILAAAGTIATIVAPAARADGLPVLGIDVGSSGVTVPGAGVRYVTLPAGRSTIVAAVQRDGGRIVRSFSWPGTFTIPAVAYDGSAGGLSADRRTLVLIEPRVRFPRAQTRLLVVDARSLRQARLVQLRGDFSFDAVSPDGSRIYLIQYTSATDPTRYLVRSYDARDRRLEPRPIVDPRDRTEKMRGNPISRATSFDGRFAYTLYDGGGSHPFIHALDTARGTARCIDVDLLPAQTPLWDLRLRMSSDGSSVTVVRGARSLLALDTHTLTLTAATRRAASKGRPTVLYAAAALLALLLMLALLVARRAGALRAGGGPASSAGRRDPRRAAVPRAARGFAARALRATRATPRTAPARPSPSPVSPPRP
jgi:hypothetical protein